MVSREEDVGRREGGRDYFNCRSCSSDRLFLRGRSTGGIIKYDIMLLTGTREQTARGANPRRSFSRFSVTASGAPRLGRKS